MQKVPGYLLISLGALALALSAGRKFVMIGGGTLEIRRLPAALLGVPAIGVGIFVVRR